jgi:lysozyme
VRKLNAQDYAGACQEILRWDNFQGKPLKGLTLRREKEYRQCISGS